MTQDDPNIGRQLLGGQFQIVEKIGSGRVAAVYKAVQPAMNRMVAIKIPHPWHIKREDIMSRLRREARAMSHLTHPNTGKVFFYGELEDHTPYIVMELLEGEHLAQVVQESGPLPGERAIPIVIQVCGALEEAHRQGIFHRDLKPDDIVLTSVGGLTDFPKLIDFGLAKVTKREIGSQSHFATANSATAGSAIPSSIAYASPEQLTDAGIDARSDIYSLAVILYEMLTGKLPHDASTVSEYALLTVASMPIPLNERVRGKTFSRKLDIAIAKALERHPEDRYASAADFADALSVFTKKKVQVYVTESDGGVPKEGDVIEGKYVIERVLGAGGMGVVVAAWDAVLRRQVAIKLMLPRAMRVQHAQERFKREARAAAAIASEHVVRIIGIETPEDYPPFIIMEHLNGLDLGQLLASRGPLPVQEAIDYMLQVCEATNEAHLLGLVHRDIKPANIFIASRADGSSIAKVLDFGLSKVMTGGAEGDDGSLTATNLVAGSPHYMSPEQVRSLKNVDARTDIWSIGAVVYEILSGKRPFEAETVTAILSKILTDTPPPLRPLRSEVSPELEAIVFRCLQKSVDHRTQTLAELASALAPFGSPASSTLVERIVKARSASGGAKEPPQGPDISASETVADSTPELASTIPQSEPADSLRLKPM